MGASKFPLVPAPQGGTPNLPQPGQPAPMRPDEFIAGSVANVTTFNFDRIAPPSPLYLQRDDIVELEAATSSTPVTVHFTLRFLRVPEPTGGQPSEGGVGRSPGAIFEHGVVETITKDLILPANSLTRGFALQLAEGYLLGVGATVTPNVLRGQVFAAAFLIRGSSTQFSSTSPLFADYATANYPVGWPNGRTLNFIEGPGWKHSLQVTNPLAGVDWTLTLGPNQRLRIESLNAVFTAAVAIANRQVQLIVDDGVNVVGVFPAASNIVASTISNVTVTAGSVNTPIITTDVLIPIPQPLILQPGWRLRTTTAGIQAADTWTAIWLNLEEWLEGI